MKTSVYIDGFNLYYRAVKDTSYKWLDLSKVCEALLPSHEVSRIRYFTALLQPRPGNPQVESMDRQVIYIRALETIPNLTVHYGQFRSHTKLRPLATPTPGLQRTVEILDTEEKRTDVNLATYLLLDGFYQDYEQALVVSNDSDLALPIRKVRERLGFPVGVVNPNLNQKAVTPKELTDAASFIRRLRPNTLRRCQFPPKLSDAVGTITKPVSW